MSYADLSLRPKKGQLEGLLRAAAFIGFSLVAVPPSVYDDAVNLGRSLGVSVLRRVEVVVRTPDDLTRALSSVRGSDILVVVPLNMDAFRRAGKVRRVDIIRVVPEAGLRPDVSQRNLLAERGGGVIEFSLRPLLIEGQGRYMAWLAESIIRSLRSDLRVALVSDAEYWHELWHPLHVAGLIGSAGIPSWSAVAAFSSVPGFVVSRVSKRASLQGVLGKGPGGQQ